MMFRLTSENQSTLEHAIERAATLHEKQAFRRNGNYTRFFHLGNFDPSYPDLCVKYTDHVDILLENSMLLYLYALASQDGDAAPHVPRPVHYFKSTKNVWGYIVMERLEMSEVANQELQSKTSDAVRWMYSKGPPPGTIFGCIGKSPARHTLFKMNKAPFVFTSLVSVEKYLNTAVRMAGPQWMELSDVLIASEKVVLSQTDMHPSNFGVAPDGRAIIFDAATIQAMPLTLADFSLLYTTPFATAVSKYVFSPDERSVRWQSPTMKSLVQARGMLSMNSDDTLGLDEDGNIIQNHRRRRSRAPQSGPQTSEVLKLEIEDGVRKYRVVTVMQSDINES